MTITEQLAEALREAAEGVDAAMGMVEQSVIPDWDWLRKVRHKSRSALAAYEASKADVPCKHPRAEYDSDGLWCPDCDPTPAQGQDREVWLIYYEDADMQPEIFSGEAAADCAQTRYEQVTDNWNCTLFRSIHAQGQDIEGLVEEACTAFVWYGADPPYMPPYLRQRMRAALLAVQQKRSESNAGSRSSQHRNGERR